MADRGDHVIKFCDMKIEDLIEEGESIFSRKAEGMLGDYIPMELFDPWRRKALMFLQQNYPQHPQVKTFEQYVGANNDSYHCTACLSILKAFRDVQPQNVIVDYDGLLQNIFNRFFVVAKQLQRRHDGRGTLAINDEYDVQDLLNSLLLLHFDDVRPEEWTPSYAGGSKRIDFLLKDSEIAIEVKMTRKGLKDKELGEQLIIDIANYKQHKNCKCLYCFVYDPEGYIRNPRGMERDLQALDKEFPVRVFVRPVF